jgi:hypothetical protein
MITLGMRLLLVQIRKEKLTNKNLKNNGKDAYNFIDITQKCEILFFEREVFI